MKIYFYRLFIFFHFFLHNPLFAQLNPEKRACATTQANELLLQQHPEIARRMQLTEKQAQEYLKNHPERRTDGTVRVIPVVFHVVYNTPAQNITVAQLKSQLDVLNEDFNRENRDTIHTPLPFRSLAGNPRIFFCLAILDEAGNKTDGITRTPTAVTEFDYRDNAIKYTAQGGHDAWNPDLYLNIWVGNLADNVIGYAQFPGLAKATDGVVLKYSSVGTKPFNPFPGPYTYGRTATHEIGHWLGLQHIWGGDGANCVDTDLITDTPNQAESSEGCPSFPVNSCPGPDAPYGDMFMNFMDYTNDECMNLFTKGQAAKMIAILETSRASLLTSNVCSNEINADFRAEPEAIFPGQTTNFFYYSNGRRPDNFLWTFEGGTPGTSTHKNPQGIRYDMPGSYTVTLTVSDANGSDTEIKRHYIHVTTRELALYPNPADDYLTIGAPADQKIKEVRIYDTAGKLLFRQEATERAVTVPVHQIRNGLYVVQVRTESDDYLSNRVLILRN